MSLQQQPNEPPAKRSLGRALLWPVAAAWLGLLMILNSAGPASDTHTFGPPGVGAPAVPAPAAPSASPSASAEASAGARPGVGRSAPTRLRIPSIAVNAPFVPLALGPSGQLDAPPPDDGNLVGWFRDGVTPGEPGTAIVAGHVDTMTGPGVFIHLSSLRPGNLVDVKREDGSIATFLVDSVESFRKADFPDELVYADTPDPQLRLITCGGEYDRKAKDYKENVVVFAHLASVR